MRILLVSNLFPPYAVGGYERMAGWVADGLRARGHRVEVLTGRGPALSREPDLRQALDLDLAALESAHFGDGISFAGNFAEGMRRHVFSGRNFRATRAALDQSRPDLVSFWNPAFITFSPLLAARTLQVPSVVHLSDTAVNPFRNPHPPAFPRLLRPAARLAVDALLRVAGARQVVVPSAFLRDKLVAREGVRVRQLTVLPWPAPLAAGGEPVAPRRGHVSRFMFVGSLAPEKGVRVLLEAFRDVWRQRPDLTLTVVGDGARDEVSRLEAQASGLPVRFRGRLEHAEVLAAYREHDVLVFPSVWDEPFGIVPLEAAAMGLAVIATDAGGTPEAFRDGETALLIRAGEVPPLAQAMLRLAAEPERAHALAEAGRRHVRATYDFATFMTRLETIYAECLSGRRAS